MSNDLAATSSNSPQNRWIIPVGAVLVHVCIGSVYAWSTFNRPIQAVFPDVPWWFTPPYPTFTTALALLGLSAAFGGPWVERRGPRVAATAAALFFGTGLLIGGVGLWLRQMLLVFLGMGVIGGIGCGLGYISPVSTLVKWFPDRRGMATGMAIMGFGGGAFIAGYLNVALMDRLGVATTVMALGAIYLVIMLCGARLMRHAPGRMAASRMDTSRDRQRDDRHDQRVAQRGPAHVAVLPAVGHPLHQTSRPASASLAQASPMMQDMFKRTPLEAAAVVSLISLFNAGGRFLWASGSDYIGRRNTYTIFFAVQFVLFLLIPGLAARGSWWAFQASLFVVFTMYGGGFATIPAFLADIFGPRTWGPSTVHCSPPGAWPPSRAR
jgi:MFS family permease